MAGANALRKRRGKVLARQIKGKVYSAERQDLHLLKEALDLAFAQVYTSAPTKTEEKDFYLRFTIVIGTWEDQPATQRQLLALLSMGCMFDDDITKGEASRIIKDQIIRRATG